MTNNFDKNMLFISQHYKYFIKDQVEFLGPYFNDVYVLVRYNPMAELSKFFSNEFLNQHRKKFVIDLINKPFNINVILTPVYYLPFDAYYKSLGENHFRAVNKSIRKNNLTFDIVHSHFTWSAGYVGAKLKERHDIKLIVTAHGFDIYDLPFKDNEWKNKIKYVLNTADHIITVSNRNLEYIHKLNIKTPVEVIPNGFRTDLFYPRESTECRKYLTLPLDKKILLTIGNLLDVKGHKYFIEAAHELVKHRNDFVCIIVGDGKLKKKLAKLIKIYGLEKYVYFVGIKPHNEIPIWINACDLFILPSLNEGNPTVMFECLGCGKPFVGTKVGGVPEIITSEDYGLLCEPKNSHDLAEKISIAFEKEWDREKILEYAKTFRWEKIVKQIAGVYNKVILD